MNEPYRIDNPLHNIWMQQEELRRFNRFLERLRRKEEGKMFPEDRHKFEVKLSR